MIERTCCSPNCREQTDTGNSELQDLSANSYQNLPGGFSMSSRTRIVVLHMKEIIYTAIFAALAILLIILLIVMFRPSGKSAASGEKKQYTPGVYTSTLTLNNTNLEVEVAVTDSEISSIRFSNLDETVTTMFPLVQPALEDIADQICRTQSLENISFPEDAPYTSQLILNAVTQAVEKATVQ